MCHGAWQKVMNYEQVLPYAVIDEEYANMIEEGTAEDNLQVLNPSGKKIQTLELKSAVKQIMSCRNHEGDAENDKIYFLLWSGKLDSVSIA